MLHRLFFGDCLEEMKNIPDGSIDMILTDPPYGTTQCKWDSIIPLGPMWEQLERVIKPSGAIALFGSEPFSSALRMSNINHYKYDWIWQKSKATGHLNSKKRPLVKHEIISIFYRSQTTYNPQGLIKKKTPTISKGNRGKNGNSSGECYGTANKDALQIYKNYPKSIINFNVDAKAEFHSTQKPVLLLEYLIKTYTNSGDTVLDFAMGSGSTLIACRNLNRNSRGIDNGYCEKDKIINGISIKGMLWTDIVQLRLNEEF